MLAAKASENGEAGMYYYYKVVFDCDRNYTLNSCRVDDVLPYLNLKLNSEV
jgi:hypothetical protein